MKSRIIVATIFVIIAGILALPPLAILFFFPSLPAFVVSIAVAVVCGLMALAALSFAGMMVGGI